MGCKSSIAAAGNGYRLEKSLELMEKYPDKNFTEIAGNSGFRNIRSFNQAFKDYYLFTPREYMKKHYAPKEKAYWDNPDSE